MIKRTMYFYDKKQADLIKKVNDKLHRSRGVRVSDVDYIPLSQLNAMQAIKNINSSQDKYINTFISNIEKLLMSISSEEQHKKINSNIQKEAKNIKIYVSSLINNYNKILSYCDDIINRM